MAKLTSEEREILINALVENEAIEEDDRETFEELKDSKLIAFADAVLNADEESDEEEEDEDEEIDDDIVDNEESDDEELEDEELEDDEDEEDDEELATNTHVCNKCAGKMKGKKGKHAPEEEDEMTGNAMTSEEWLASAPPEIAEVVHNAMKFATDEKAKLIAEMTANMSGTQKMAAINVLVTNSLDQLKVLAPGMIQKAPVSTQVTGLIRRGPTFNGAATSGGVTANKGKSESQPLIMPTINWKEAQKEFASQN